MHDTTLPSRDSGTDPGATSQSPAPGESPSASGHFPDDELRQLLSHLVRAAGLLEANPEPHLHGGVRVSTSEVFALAELTEAGSLSQQDLADRLGLEKSTVSRLAAGLEGRGWLIRERNVANRRFYRLRLTAEGLAVARRVGAELREHHARLLDKLTPVERHALTVGLGGLIRAMHEHVHHWTGSPPKTR